LTSKVYETASLIRRRFARFGASHAVRRVSEISRSDYISQYSSKLKRVSLVAMFGMSPRDVSVPCWRGINRDSQQNQGANHHSSQRGPPFIASKWHHLAWNVRISLRERTGNEQGIHPSIMPFGDGGSRRRSRVQRLADPSRVASTQ